MASKQVIIEGRNTIHDALISNKIITTILISKSVLNAQRIRDIENLALKKKTLIKKVSPDQIKHLSESGKAGGVIAYMELPEPPTLEKILQTKPNPFLILINKLDYEQNLGAILRSAWAAGVDAVLVGNSGIHDITPIVAKVSQGAVAHVPLIATSLFQSLAILKKYAVPVVEVEWIWDETILNRISQVQLLSFLVAKQLVSQSL